MVPKWGVEKECPALESILEFLQFGDGTRHHNVLEAIVTGHSHVSQIVVLNQPPEGINIESNDHHPTTLDCTAFHHQPSPARYEFQSVG
jgi:hypothetical protein